MARKNSVKDINLRVIDVRPFHNDQNENEGIIIKWASDIGWGEYTIWRKFNKELYSKEVESHGLDEYFNENTWYADTEYMDYEDDKEFGQELLRLWLEQIYVR